MRSRLKLENYDIKTKKKVVNQLKPKIKFIFIRITFRYEYSKNEMMALVISIMRETCNLILKKKRELRNGFD